MKKTATILFSLLLMTHFVMGQGDYKVIRVNGTILIKKDGSALSQGSVFSEDDNLVFKTDNSQAAVINPKKGRFLLKPDNTSDLASAKSNFLPAMSNISSRAGALVNSMDLKNHFAGKYVVLDQARLKINKEKFPMDENNFFYLRYMYKNEEINKKLAFIGDTLLLTTKDIFEVDGQPISGMSIESMKLYYLKGGNESVLINEFNPVFPKTEDLKGEVSIILDEFAQKTYDEKVDEVMSYLNEFYGKPDKDNVDAWLKHNFKLK